MIFLRYKGKFKFCIKLVLLPLVNINPANETDKNPKKYFKIILI
jgi:hypothetical protein